MASCRTCNAAIVWARTTAGNNIPLDADPEGQPLEVEAGGIVFVAWEGPHRIVRAEPGADGYRAHFSTCPQADVHRRPR